MPAILNDNPVTDSGGTYLPHIQDQSVHEQQPENTQPHPLQRSTHIPIPTSRADPENAPPSQVQKAVEESIAAGKQLKAQREVSKVLDQNSETSNQGTVSSDQSPDISDLIHIVSIDNIEQLLIATQGLQTNCNPTASNINENPQLWSEAKLSGYANHWKAAYCEELNSLHDMGVYKLIPRSAVPAGQKFGTRCPVFKIKHDKHGNMV